MLPESAGSRLEYGLLRHLRYDAHGGEQVITASMRSRGDWLGVVCFVS